MFRNCCLFFLLLPVVLASASASAQVAPAVRGGGANLWAGAEYSNFNSDQSNQRSSGIGAWVDFNRDAHWSAEAELRYLRFVPSYTATEDNYLLGPRYMCFRHGKLQPYVKVLFGVGLIDFPFDFGHGSYFMFASGGGVDYQVKPKISVRAEYEYQFMPSAPGIPGLPSHGVTPNGFSFGVAYRLFQAGASRR